MSRSASNSDEVPAVIARHLDELLEICRQFGVARLEVFGSATTPEFDPLLSDLDFLVTYPEEYEFGPWLARHNQLRERLTELFRRRVDLVMTPSTGFRNPYFAQSVAESRRVLYAA